MRNAGCAMLAMSSRPKIREMPRLNAAAQPPTSSPAPSAFASRSQENRERLALVLRRRVRVDDVARLELVGVEHDLLARPAELLDARALDLLVLHHQGAPPGPLPVLAELDLAHDGVELGVADVVGHLLLVEALGGLDGPGQDLAGGG